MLQPGVSPEQSSLWRAQAPRRVSGLVERPAGEVHRFKREARKSVLPPAWLTNGGSDPGGGWMMARSRSGQGAVRVPAAGGGVCLVAWRIGMVVWCVVMAVSCACGSAGLRKPRS